MDDKKKNKKEDVIASEAKQSDINEEIATSQAPRNDNEQQEDSKEVVEHILTEKLVEVEGKYKRALADYQNLVRRTQEEKREWAQFANKDIVLKFLPILDTLMLAEKHTKDQNFILTVSQFLQVLHQEGVTRIKTIGEEFNPHTMEVVTTATGAENTVVDEMRAGYMLGKNVLRPAQVIVGK